MSQLREIQEQFTAAILQREQHVAAEISRGKNIDALTRISIYRSSVKGIHTDALAAVYPVVKKLVGDHFFLGMALSYLDQHPSVTGNLHDLGDQMDDFIRSFPPAEPLPYLADVATLEWLWHCAFHASDSSSFPLEKLASVNEEQQPNIVFTLSAGAALIKSSYPLLPIWRVNQDNAEEEAIDLASGGTSLVVSRKGYAVAIEELTPNQFAFLQCIEAKKTLGEISGTVDEIDALLPYALSQGWLDNFYIRD